MPNYKAYAKEKDTPSRKARKGDRNKVYVYNRALGAKLRREKRLAREQALEQQEETVEE